MHLAIWMRSGLKARVARFGLHVRNLTLYVLSAGVPKPRGLPKSAVANLNSQLLRGRLCNRLADREPK